MKSYCVKQNKETECTQTSGYKTAKNGRAMFWCTCAECGIKKQDLFQKQVEKDYYLEKIALLKAYQF